MSVTFILFFSGGDECVLVERDMYLHIIILQPIRAKQRFKELETANS